MPFAVSGDDCPPGADWTDGVAAHVAAAPYAVLHTSVPNSPGGSAHLSRAARNRMLAQLNLDFTFQLQRRYVAVSFV